MANLTRAMTSEWLKKRTKQPIFISNHEIFATPVSSGQIAAMFLVGFDTQ